MQRTQDVGHGDERVGQVELRGEHDDGIWEEARGYIQTGSWWVGRGLRQGSSRHGDRGGVVVQIKFEGRSPRRLEEGVDRGERDMAPVCRHRETDPGRVAGGLGWGTALVNRAPCVGD